MTSRGNTADINGARIYYEIFGSGPPLLMLHGGTESSRCWSAQIEFFSRRFKLILPDTRGHGRSTDTDQPFGYAQFASDMAALLDHLRIKTAFLCGSSDGGIIGLHLGIHHPGRIERQILLGANYHVDGLLPEFRVWLRRMSRSEGSIKWTGDLIEEYKRLSPQGPDSWDRFLKKVLALWSSEPDYTEAEIASIEIPTLVIAGDRDPFVRLDHTTALFKRLPRGALCILPNGDHNISKNKAEQFNPISLEFFLREERLLDIL